MNPSAFTIIISLGIILMYLAYLGVTIPLLRMRLRRLAGQPARTRKEGLFALGSWGVAVNVVAILYGVGDGHQPRCGRASRSTSTTPTSGGRSSRRSVLFGFGLIYYYAVQQHKSGVLEEHRAEAAAGD